MARYWDDKEIPGRGIKFCLVVDPEDGTNPIRTYGWSKDEVLEKVAKTAETAQATINRLRAQPQQAQQTAAKVETPAAPVMQKPTPEEMIEASINITDPARATSAVKTLLRDAGLDLDAQERTRKINKAVEVFANWEKNTPAFPADLRNSRILYDRALILANGKPEMVTNELLDEAFAECTARGTMFEPEPENEQEVEPQRASSGNSETRVRPRGVAASSYRRTDLSASSPSTNRKPKYTRAEIDAMNTKEFQEKVLEVPEVLAWYNRELSAVA